MCIRDRYNGNADCASKGAVRNIAFYDFAMDATAATAWNTNGKVTETDVAGLKTIKSISDVSFGENDATKSALNVGMTDEQMLAQLNAATATLTLSDNATLTANVVWDRVTSENGKYYAVGSVNTSKLGYANLAGEVKYELTAVSYTHLDVYKRQVYGFARVGARRRVGGWRNLLRAFTDLRACFGHRGDRLYSAR